MTAMYNSHYSNAQPGDPHHLSLRDAINYAGSIALGEQRKANRKQRVAISNIAVRLPMAYPIEEELRRVEAQMAKTRRPQLITP